MIPRFYSTIVFITLIGCSALSWADFIGLYSAVRDVEQNYLGESSQQQAASYGATLNMQPYRRHPTGWFARGPRLQLEQSAYHRYIDAHAPLYQHHTHQGLWLQFEQQIDNLATTISESQRYLKNTGISQNLPVGSRVLFERQRTKAELYWYESVKEEGPINTIGLFYVIQSSPVSAQISTSNANIFDGRFSGFGFSLGRINNDRGLNFQWQLQLAQLDIDLSDNATNHKSLSSAQSTAYQFKLALNWHYRHYLAPYWYFVPRVHYNYQMTFQGQREPEFIEHETLSLSELSAAMAIEYYF